jgi:polyferredoxin
MSTSINKSISSIPVKVIGPGPGKVSSGFRWKRRTAQVLTLVLAALIPASGLFRIDPMAGAFVVLDRQIWFSDFFLISGLWIMLASGLVSLYSVAGTAFCGWSCPQNTLAEWANHMTRKLLGKRAEVSLDGEAPQIAAAKNKALNWLLLGASFLLASMLVALIPLFYFYPPDVVWSFISFRQDARLAGSLHWIYTVCVLIIFLDIAVIRHFWCRFSCVYKVWQHSFRTKQTLHVTYDASRSAECAKCNYCSTACFIDLDPRKTETYDTCINCGDCIDACNQLQSKKGAAGLLRFELGERKQGKVIKLRNNAMSLFSRFGWTAPFTILGAAMFVWGVWSYEPYHLSVYRAETAQSLQVLDYRIAISNKLYRPAELSVRVEGLPPGSFNLSTRTVKLDRAGRASVTLSILPGLRRGLYPVLVEVRAPDGWTGRFRLQHLSS